MFRSSKFSISISIPRPTLEAIFDECDGYEVDETGGRIIGSYHAHGKQLDIQVQGIIGPGPNARRSPTSFFQDGEYQENIFRSVEATHPSIEHLGNWHTHHVNGLDTLSGGDRTTYFATVNHVSHNTDFFYALLVVRRTPGRKMRYEIKHFVFRRNEDSFREIPHEQVKIVDAPVVWPLTHEHTPSPTASLKGHREGDVANLERAKDQEFFSEFYPALKGLFSKRLSALYWKGALVLVDGSRTEVAVIEHSGEGAPSYSIAGTSEDPTITDVSATFEDRRFRSARHALLHFERDLNHAVYRRKAKT